MKKRYTDEMRMRMLRECSCACCQSRHGTLSSPVPSAAQRRERPRHGRADDGSGGRPRHGEDVLHHRILGGETPAED